MAIYGAAFEEDRPIKVSSQRQQRHCEMVFSKVGYQQVLRRMRMLLPLVSRRRYEC